MITDIKKIAEIVDKRSNGLCEVCESNYIVQKHHIIGGNGKRTQYQNQYSVINLCWYCHHGINGWHGKNGRPLQLKIRKQLQEKYKELGYSEEETRELMGGRLY